MIPLFPAGVPGGTELVVLLLVVFVGVVPLIAVAVGAYLFGISRGRAETLEQDRRGGDDERRG